MLIQFEGSTYEYDITAGITVKEAMPIKLHTGHGVKSWWRAVADLEPEAVQSLLWLLKRRNGEQCDMASLDFDIMAFLTAFNEAAAAEEGKRPAPKVRKANSNAASTA